MAVVKIASAPSSGEPSPFLMESKALPSPSALCAPPTAEELATRLISVEKAQIMSCFNGAVKPQECEVIELQEFILGLGAKSRLHFSFGDQAQAAMLDGIVSTLRTRSLVTQLEQFDEEEKIFYFYLLLQLARGAQSAEGDICYSHFSNLISTGFTSSHLKTLIELQSFDPERFANGYVPSLPVDLDELFAHLDGMALLMRQLEKRSDTLKKLLLFNNSFREKLLKQIPQSHRRNFELLKEFDTGNEQEISIFFTVILFCPNVDFIANQVFEGVLPILREINSLTGSAREKAFFELSLALSQCYDSKTRSYIPDNVPRVMAEFRGSLDIIKTDGLAKIDDLAETDDLAEKYISLFAGVDEPSLDDAWNIIDFFKTFSTEHDFVKLLLEGLPRLTPSQRVKFHNDFLLTYKLIYDDWEVYYHDVLRVLTSLAHREMEGPFTNIEGFFIEGLAAFVDPQIWDFNQAIALFTIDFPRSLFPLLRFFKEVNVEDRAIFQEFLAFLGWARYKGEGFNELIVQITAATASQSPGDVAELLRGHRFDEDVFNSQNAPQEGDQSLRSLLPLRPIS